jgi:hypothetical protein
MHRLIGIDWREDGEGFHQPNIYFPASKRLIFKDKEDAVLVVKGYHEKWSKYVVIEVWREGRVRLIAESAFKSNMLHYPELVWEDERSTQEI